MREEILLTNKIVKNLPIPEKRIYYRDSKERGLIIQITPKGKKSYYLNRKCDGKCEHFLIGEAQYATIQYARKRAKELKAGLILGVNPNDQKRILRENASLQQLFEIFMKDRGEKLSPKTKEQYVGIWEREIRSRFARKKMALIKPETLKKFHHKLSQKSAYIANRAIAIIRSMYNYAIRECLYQYKNPTRSVILNREIPRVRALTPKELANLLSTLKTYSDSNIKDFVLIALSTGARKSNILSMKWENIDLDIGKWLIPKTKTDQNVTLPLVPIIVDILKKRKQYDISNSVWVFPAHSKSGHMESPGKAFKKLMEKANIEHIRIHDLRHTLASYMVASGTNPFIVQRALTHRNIQSTQVYVNLDVEFIRPYFDETVSKIMGIV